MPGSGHVERISKGYGQTLAFAREKFSRIVCLCKGRHDRCRGRKDSVVTFFSGADQRWWNM
jgi:hypothetical protein